MSVNVNEYPNIEAHGQGCTDSNIKSWVMMRSECLQILEELHALREENARLKDAMARLEHKLGLCKTTGEMADDHKEQEPCET